MRIISVLTCFGRKNAALTMAYSTLRQSRENLPRILEDSNMLPPLEDTPPAPNSQGPGKSGASSGDPERFVALYYEELRQVARGLMRCERDGHTLDPTGLVNE